MVSSDNGARVTDYWGRWWGHKSNGDLRGQKADIWDGGHREPLVARWPGHIKPGSVCDKLVCLSDLMATCTDVLGVELPEDSAEDSISFLPLLEDTQRGKHVRDSVIHHSGFGMFSIRKGDWKLINELGSGGFTEPCRWKAGPDDPGGQLYNLKNDLRETNNLWRQHPEIVAELTAELNTL